MRVLLCGLLLSGCSAVDTRNHDWPSYLGGTDRNHYSVLSQIDTSNVGLLQEAWEYHAGDSGQVQCNPIIVDGILYGVTASNHLFALDAGTGAERWRFQPDSTASAQVNRGVAHWRRGDDRRILYAYQSWLYAVNADTGEPIHAFGDHGRVSLREGLGDAAGDKFVVSTTPGTVFEDLIVMPIRVGEGPGAAPGYIQAFNVVSGKLAWVFRTIPHPGEFGYETWPAEAYRDPAIGGANNWAGMAVDPERGFIYVPTGSPAFDFYGGNRKGENLFANSLLALDARTGTYLWHYQAVRHDLWDRDFPAPPNLVRLRRDGKTIDAVAQVTKSGHVFVFDRETGESLFPIDEVNVPSGNLPGEAPWPTQPVPRLPKPFARQTLSEGEITHFSANRDSLLTVYRQASKGAFHPLGFNETLLFPGADGGAEWGGAAVDPDGIMYINSNEMAWLFSLSRKEGLRHEDSATPGKQLYVAYCMACHKPDLSGNPSSGYPSLVRLKDRMARKAVMDVIATGKGMMPGFTNIDASQKQALVSYLFGEEKEEVFFSAPANNGTDGMPYTFNGYNKFLDENGYPAIAPPWGTLTAIDLATGMHRWQIPLGEFEELSAKGIPPTGTENYGGPLITAGGLLFIAATKDGLFRAFHKESGELLWQAELPAAGFATPATYAVDGTQYIVIACGGTKLGTRKGDSYVAFSLK